MGATGFQRARRHEEAKKKLEEKPVEKVVEAPKKPAKKRRVKK